MISLPVSELKVKEIFKIIRRRSWVIAVCLIVCVVFLVSHDLFSPKIYEASTTVLLEKRLPAQQKLLHSYHVAEGVFKKLDLAETPEYKDKPKPVKRLLATVRIRPVANSRMWTITARGDDPRQVQDIASAWVVEFIKLDVGKRAEAGKKGISRLEKQFADASRKLQLAQQKLDDFKKNNRTVVDKQDLLEQLAKQKDQLHKEIKELSKTAEAKDPRIGALNYQAGLVDERLAAATKELAPMRDKAREYNNLSRDVRNYGNVVNDIFKRQKELEVTDRLTSADIKVVDPARVPKAPTAMPLKIRIFMLVMSLVLGTVVGFYIEVIDPTLRSSVDIEKAAGLTFLGYIPKIDGKAKEKEKCLVFGTEPESTVGEAFRYTRVAMVFSAPDGKPLKTILVTSSVNREGKTFVASNLATAFAIEGQPTLLIDADMKKGRLGEIFDVQKEPGLSDVLSGKTSIQDAIKTTSIEHLSIMPSGTHTDNPSVILNEDNLSTLFPELQAKFRKIIVDVPSILKHPDLIAWETKTDGLLMVIKDGSTPLKAIKLAKSKFTKELTTVGAILNNTRIDKDIKEVLHSDLSDFMGSLVPKRRSE